MIDKMPTPGLSRAARSYLTVLGTSLIYFAMGLYFAAGNTAVYLTSYLIYRANSDMKLDDAIWFLSVAGFSALLLPLGGWLERRLGGVRGVCLLGGSLQSCGIFATYYALDTTFFWVVLIYGGSFMLSLASCYTSPLVNVCKWHPKHKGLVTGIGSASMALAPTLFTPLITALVNPENLAANELGLFDDEQILDNTKRSTLYQGAITTGLFLIGTLLTFPFEDGEQQIGRNGRDIEANTEKSGSSSNNNNGNGQAKVSPNEPVLLMVMKLGGEFKGWHNEAKLAPSAVEGGGKLDSGQGANLANLRGQLGGEGQSGMPDGKSQIDRHQKQQQQQQRPVVVFDCSLRPRLALRTLEFWLLSLKVLISELIFIYLLFMYKPYGQTFIQDDYFLSSVGAACAISNTLGRLTMGHVKDKLGFKAVSIPLSATTMLFVSLMPLTMYLPRLCYATTVVLAVGAVGSQYALVPSAAQDSFGDRYASVNIGFVYMSTVGGTLLSALFSQNLTSLIGWSGMIVLVAACAALDFLATFFMPANPRRKLIDRYNQFHRAPPAGQMGVKPTADWSVIAAA